VVAKPLLVNGVDDADLEGKMKETTILDYVDADDYLKNYLKKN